MSHSVTHHDTFRFLIAPRTGASRWYRDSGVCATSSQPKGKVRTGSLSRIRMEAVAGVP